MKHSAQWLIRTENGKQLGPYSTEAVLRLISEGAFSGLEMIKSFPEGKWIPFSREPDFYDRLLDALAEKNLKSKVAFQKQQKIDAETVIQRTSDLPEAFLYSDEAKDEDQSGQQPGPPKDNPLKPLPEAKEEPKERTSTNIASRRIDNELEVKREQKNSGVKSKKITRVKKKQSLVIPLVLILVAMGLGYYALEDANEDSTHAEGKISLIYPRPATSNRLSEGDYKKQLRLAVSLFAQDTFEAYAEAQNKLVSLVEGYQSANDARGLLCLVYKEIWLFTKQDSKDLETATSLARTTRSADPIGVNAVYCDIMKMMIDGKLQEARGVVEYALNQQKFATIPILYQLKAEQLAYSEDHSSAVLYLDKAIQLWPEWVRPNIDQGRFYNQLGKAGEAYKSYSKVLTAHPDHKVAQVEIGILLYDKLKRSDDAEKYLMASVSSDKAIPRALESRANFILALINADSRNLSKAKDFARQAYKLNPGDPQIKSLIESLGGTVKISEEASQAQELVFLGDQFARTGNWMAAQAEYKTAFEIDPKNAVAAMKIAKSLKQLSQSQQSIAWLNKAIGADPKLTGAYLLLADYHSENFNFTSAIQALQRAQQLIPNNYEVLRGFGMVELRRNNAKDALPYLQKAQKIYEYDSETLIQLARAYTLLKDYQSAQSSAVRAIELDATNSEAQIAYAKVLARFQGVDTGALYLKDLINKYSYTFDFRLALAEIYRDEQRYRDAQAIFEQILEQRPKNKKAILGLGECNQAQAQFDKALKYYLDATVYDPSDAEGLVKAGLVYLDLQKYNEAITQFKRARMINPYFPSTMYYIAKAAFELSEYEQALNALAEEKKMNPFLVESYILTADIYAAMKQFSKCASEYQRAADIRPQAVLFVKLARCYRQSGSNDIAESMLTRAASIESGLPDIYREQGAVFEVKGEFRAAVASYSKYLALSPNAPDRKDVEARVQMIGNKR